MLTFEDEFAFGTDAPEILDVQANGLSNNDRIDGGGDSDTLRMIEMGTLDLLAPNQLDGMEIITGSGGDDRIVSNANRLTGIITHCRRRRHGRARASGWGRV